MASLYILDDDPNDLSVATALAAKAGFTRVETQMSSRTAMMFFAKALEDHTSLPDVIIVDLDLGVESGYELLRFCHSNRLMTKMHVVVWTLLGDRERNICQIFGVEEFVSKTAGPASLLEALARLNAIGTAAAPRLDGS